MSLEFQVTPGEGRDAEPTAERVRRPDIHLWGRAGVAAFIVVLCTLIFVGQWWVCGCDADESGWWWRSLWTFGACDQLRVWGLEVASVWLADEWWRVATAIFVHGSWLHLVLNMWSLIAIGTWVERALGPAMTVFVFLLSGFAGCLASLGWADGAVVVGASGGIFGLAGALWVLRSFGSPALKRRLDPVSATSLGASMLVLLLVGGVVPVVAQAGHVGGLVTGMLLGVVGRKPRRSGLFGALTIAVWMGVLAWSGHAPGRRAQDWVLVGLWWLDRGAPEEAVTAFDRVRGPMQDDSVFQNAQAYALAESRRDLSRAEALARKALKADPSDPDTLDTLGWILCLKGHSLSGTEFLFRARARTHGVAVVDKHLALCPIEAGMALEHTSLSGD